MSTVFAKIIRKELPAEVVFENDLLIAIKDIHPHAPIHILIMPKKEFKDLQSVPKKELSIFPQMMEVVQMLAKKFGIEHGYRLLTNNGEDAGQTIFHMHFHLIGGKVLDHLC